MIRSFVVLGFLAIVSSCSTDGVDNLLSFSVKDSCKKESLEKTNAQEHAGAYVDTVFFVKKEDGSASGEIEIGVSCGGIQFDLESDMNGDTLFIDSKEKGDVATSCFCTAVLEVVIPSDYANAQILVCNKRRLFPEYIVYTK